MTLGTLRRRRRCQVIGSSGGPTSEFVNAFAVENDTGGILDVEIPLSESARAGDVVIYVSGRTDAAADDPSAGATKLGWVQRVNLNLGNNYSDAVFHYVLVDDDVARGFIIHESLSSNSTLVGVVLRNVGTVELSLVPADPDSTATTGFNRVNDVTVNTVSMTPTQTRGIAVSFLGYGDDDRTVTFPSGWTDRGHTNEPRYNHAVATREVTTLDALPVSAWSISGAATRMTTYTLICYYRPQQLIQKPGDVNFTVASGDEGEVEVTITEADIPEAGDGSMPGDGAATLAAFEYLVGDDGEVMTLTETPVPGTYTISDLEPGEEVLVNIRAKSDFPRNGRWTALTATVGGTIVVPEPPVYTGGLADLRLLSGDPWSIDFDDYFTGATSYVVHSGLTGGAQSDGDKTGDLYSVAALTEEAVGFLVTAVNADGETSHDFSVIVETPGVPAAWLDDVPDIVVPLGSTVDIDVSHLTTGTGNTYSSGTVASPFEITAAGRLRSTTALNSVVETYAATITVDNAYGDAAISNSFNVGVTAAPPAALTADDINITGSYYRFDDDTWRSPIMRPPGLQPVALEEDKFLTQIGNTDVVVTSPAHGLVVGQEVEFSGVEVFSGVDLNGTFTVDLVTTNTFVVTASDPATATALGGGASAVMRPLWAAARWSRRKPDANGVIQEKHIEYGGFVHMGGGRYELFMQLAGRNGVPEDGAEVTLGSNPIATTESSTDVVVTRAGHGWAVGLTVTIDGATAVGGVTLDGNYNITAVTTDTFTVQAAATASSTATGGGASVTVQPRRSDYSVWFDEGNPTFVLSHQVVAGSDYSAWSGDVTVVPVFVEPDDEDEDDDDDDSTAGLLLPFCPRVKASYDADEPGNPGNQYQRVRWRNEGVLDPSKRGLVLTFQDENWVRVADWGEVWGNRKLAGMFASKGCGGYLNTDDDLALFMGGSNNRADFPNTSGADGIYRGNGSLTWTKRVEITRPSGPGPNAAGGGKRAFTNVNYTGNTLDRAGNMLARRPQRPLGQTWLSQADRPIYAVEQILEGGAISYIYLYKSTDNGVTFDYVRSLPPSAFASGRHGIFFLKVAPNGDLAFIGATGVHLSQDEGVSYSKIFPSSGNLECSSGHFFGGSYNSVSGIRIGVFSTDKTTSQWGVQVATNCRSGSFSRPNGNNGLRLVNGQYNVWDMDVAPYDENRLAVCTHNKYAFLSVDGAKNWIEIDVSPTAGDAANRHDIKGNVAKGHGGFIFLPEDDDGRKIVVGFGTQAMVRSVDGGRTFQGNETAYFDGVHDKANPGFGPNVGADPHKKILHIVQDSWVRTGINGAKHEEAGGIGTGTPGFKNELAAANAGSNPYVSGAAGLMLNNNWAVATATRNSGGAQNVIVICKDRGNDGEYDDYQIRAVARTRANYSGFSPKTHDTGFIGRWCLRGLDNPQNFSDISLIDRTNEFVGCHLDGGTLVSMWVNLSPGTKQNQKNFNKIFLSEHDLAQSGQSTPWYTLPGSNFCAALAVAVDYFNERIWYVRLNDRGAVREVVRENGSLVDRKLADVGALALAVLNTEVPGGVGSIPSSFSDIQALASDPNIPGLLYATVGVHGFPCLWISYDYGQTWENATGDLPRAQWVPTVHPITSDLYLGGSMGARIRKPPAVGPNWALKGALYADLKAFYDRPNVPNPPTF